MGMINNETYSVARLVMATLMHHGRPVVHAERAAYAKDSTFHCAPESEPACCPISD